VLLGAAWRAVPPSLDNIFKEIHGDLGSGVPTTLPDAVGPARSAAAQRGDDGRRGPRRRPSGQGLGGLYRPRHRDPRHPARTPVFLLWGAYAQAKGKIIDARRHRVLRAPHPSPLSAHRGFLGCRHFSAANQYLSEHGQTPIDWSLPPRAALEP
jgi:uracil-DNA glycosylase